MDVAGPADVARQIRWQDVVDVLVLTFVLYRVYLWLRGTLAVQVLAGMLALAAAAFLADHVGLLLTAYLLQALDAVAALVVVVVFQNEIRRGLGRANPIRWWRERRAAAGRIPATPAGVLAEAAFVLARRRTGAIFVLPGLDPIDEHLTGGVTLDARPSVELFEALFHTASPVHDGAIVIEGGRARLAGCFLPISTSPELPDQLGSRHRAAVGLSEACDAAVLVVSEERGQVSLVRAGALAVLDDPAAVSARLGSLPWAGRAESPDPAGARRPRRDLIALLAVFLLVTAAWWMVVGDPSTIVSRSISIELRDIPSDVDVDPPRPEHATLHLRGPRTRLDAMDPGEVNAWVDLGGAHPGRRRWPVTASAPAGIEVTEVKPDAVTLRVRSRE
jgi:uncharacterized protein (TIGR00159 family)